MIKEVSLVSIRLAFKLMILKVNIKGIESKERSLVWKKDEFELVLKKWLEIIALNSVSSFSYSLFQYKNFCDRNFGTV